MKDKATLHLCWTDSPKDAHAGCTDCLRKTRQVIIDTMPKVDSCDHPRRAELDFLIESLVAEQAAAVGPIMDQLVAVTADPTQAMALYNRIATAGVMCAIESVLPDAPWTVKHTVLDTVTRLESLRTFAASSTERQGGGGTATDEERQFLWTLDYLNHHQTLMTDMITVTGGVRGGDDDVMDDSKAQAAFDQIIARWGALSAAEKQDNFDLYEMTVRAAMASGVSVHDDIIKEFELEALRDDRSALLASVVADMARVGGMDGAKVDMLRDRRDHEDGIGIVGIKLTSKEASADEIQAAAEQAADAILGSADQIKDMDPALLDAKRQEIIAMVTAQIKSAAAGGPRAVKQVIDLSDGQKPTRH